MEENRLEARCLMVGEEENCLSSRLWMVLISVLTGEVNTAGMRQKGADGVTVVVLLDLQFLVPFLGSGGFLCHGVHVVSCSSTEDAGESAEILSSDNSSVACLYFRCYSKPLSSDTV